MIVQGNGSTLDLIFHDFMYFPDVYQVLKTTHGYVCISEMLTSYDTGGTVMELAARDQCRSPFGGEPPSNYLPDKPFKHCNKLFVQSKIDLKTWFFHQLDGNPNVKQ